MVATRVIARKGNAADVPALQPAEFGYDIDTKTARVGDDTSTPPKILTNKSTGTYDLSNLDELVLPQGTLDAIESLLSGDRGWTPVLTGEESLGRALLKITDYVGGEGDKPTDFIDYYISVNGNPTNDHNLALNIKGKQGSAGPAGSAPLISFELNNDGEMVVLISNDDDVYPATAEINEDGELVIQYQGLENSNIVSNVGRIIPFYVGEFSALEEYVSLDAVLYEGNSYYVKFGEEPPMGTLPSNTIYWVPYGGKGDIGSKELAGVTDNVASTYNITTDDIGKVVDCHASVSATVNITSQANGLWPDKPITIHIAQTGDEAVSITYDVGVTVTSYMNYFTLVGKGAIVTLIRLGEDNWLITGGLE